MDCVKVKQENAVEIKVEDIFDGNNDSDDPNDPFDNSSNESVDPFDNSSNESVSNYDSDSDNDLFKEDEEYQPKNVKEQVKEIQNKNKNNKNLQETLTLNDQVNNDTSCTSTKLSDFTILLNNKYSCNYCEVVCSRRWNMYRHLTEKHVNVIKIKQCPYCSYTSKYNLIHHINTKHKKESEKGSPILKDKVLNKSSSTKAKIRDFTVLPNNSCICNHCKVVCTLKSNMYRHIKKKHRIKQCPYCSYTSNDLNDHIITNHKEESKKLSDVLKDQVVDKSSSTNANNITNHKGECKKLSDVSKDQVVDKSSSTNVKDFTILPNNKCSCNHCKLVCNAKTNMYKHIKRMHRIKQCPYCPYTSKSNLRNHIINNHQEESKKSSDVLEDQVIDKSSSTNSNIITNHREESKKPSDVLKDQVVDKSSSTNTELSAFTILSNNKYSCNHCSFVYNFKSNMYRHIRIKHMKALKVKQCPYCSHTSKYGLIHHINTRHKKGLVKKSHVSKDQLLNKTSSTNANIITNPKEESRKPSDVLKDQVADESSSTYTCPYCSYTSKYRLTIHINETHKELEEKEYSTPCLQATDYKILANKEYGCSYCDFVAKRRLFIYKHHRRIHLKLGKYKQCPYCPYITRDDLKVHIKFRHKKKSEVDCYECHQCGYKAKGKAQLRVHLLTHKKYEEKMDYMTKCDQCSKMYLTSRLRTHKKKVHEGRKSRFSCPYCDYKSVCKDYIKKHIKRYHDNNENLKMLRCEKCSFETKFDFLLRRHRKYYHTEMHQCEKCPYQGNTLDKMRLHTISHKKVKNESDLKYRCDKCDYKTYRLYSLTVHKLKHLKPEEIQYFYCYHCDFKAKRKDNLKTHIKNHFKKKLEFVCYICDFKTNSKVSHIAHLGKHSREQNKKQNSETNYEDKKEKRKGQSSSKKPNLNDMSDKIEENETVPLKSLNINKTSDHAMTMRDRTKRKALMPSLGQISQKEI